LRTQIAIIGGGPAGMLLAHLLARAGIDSVVLEHRSRAHVLKRIRAGLLEAGSVRLLRDAGLAERMDREGIVHDGSAIVWGDGREFPIDTTRFTGKAMMAFGQTAITEELYKAREAAGGAMFDEATDVTPHDIAGTQPYVTFTRHGRRERIDCDYIAGCDGFHGVCRRTIPESVLKTYEKAYPFGWLGVMAEVPPLSEVTYAYSLRGFALASMRSARLSRYYIQCPADTRPEDWPDARFWDELKARFPGALAERIVTGPSIEKSIAPLRSFICEPMAYGRLFLAGDSAHVVPPTGAKGLNLAVSDVFYLSRAFIASCRGDDSYLARYSEMALRRVWSSARFSWRLTHLLHRFPEDGAFELGMRTNELEYIASSDAALASLAEQYVGLPYED
jgi:p-hydroxybenzoate 3-monooxygenase